MTKETICWTCKNAVAGCSWSKSFQPVDGWDADYKPIRSNMRTNETGDPLLLDSYIVKKCPLYTPERRSVKRNPHIEADPIDIGVKPKTMRKDIVECKLKGMTYKEISAKTGAAKSTITTHLRTAKALGLI